MSAQPKLKPIPGFDPLTARKDFEILSRRVYGKPLAYLDNAASAQKPRPVLDTMYDFASGEYANVHRGVHYLSAVATERYEAARETVCGFLNAAHTDEIIFTKGGTEAINLVSYSYLAPRIQPGDEIVLSVLEHHSNIVPWHFLRERQGASLRWVDVNDDGSLDADAAAHDLDDWCNAVGGAACAGDDQRRTASKTCLRRSQTNIFQLYWPRF